MRLVKVALVAVTIGAFMVASGQVVTAQGGDLNCDDFSSQAEAQAVFDADPTDPNGLDRDNDNRACQNFDYGTGGASDSAGTTMPTSPGTSTDGGSTGVGTPSAGAGEASDGSGAGSLPATGPPDLTLPIVVAVSLAALALGTSVLAKARAGKA